LVKHGFRPTCEPAITGSKLKIRAATTRQYHHEISTRFKTSYLEYRLTTEFTVIGLTRQIICINPISERRPVEAWNDIERFKESDELPCSPVVVEVRGYIDEF
jgi:hypothetical protein